VHITSSLPYRSSHSERQARLPDHWHSTVRCTWHRNHAKQNVCIGVLIPLPEGEQPRLLACRSVKVGEDAWIETRKEGSRWLFFRNVTPIRLSKAWVSSKHSRPDLG
jgi:hypothetical protein